MRARLLNFLVCPYCLTHPLKLSIFKEQTVRGVEHYPRCDAYCGLLDRSTEMVDAEDCADCARREIEEGVLSCAPCGRWYPVTDGIPSLFVDELRQGDDEFANRHRNKMEPFLKSFNPTRDTKSTPQKEIRQMRTERQTRDQQAEIYDRIFALKICGMMEIPKYRQALNGSGSTDEPFLEAGCGTGRLTPVFGRMAKEIVCVDFSLDSVKRNRWKREGERSRNTIHYLHSDLTHLPLKSNCFSRIANCQVYEHIPTAEMRQRFLRHVNRVLTPDGKFLISAYRYGPLLKFFLQKQGEHPGGIPFIRFTPAEFEAEVGELMKIERLWNNVAVYLVMAVAGRKEG
jgi:uncharacterized protein YbaR (Trm112 family)/SAM-dependent methyltransferase